MDMVRQQVSVMAPYSQDQLRRLIESMCAYLIQLNQGCPRSFREFEPMVAAEVVAGVEDVLKPWATQQDRDRSDAGANADLGTSVASWGMYGVVRRWIMDQCKEPQEEFTERVVRLIAPIIEATVASR